jgi:RimJ/RimL family protein N-acetyltransferase
MTTIRRYQTTDWPSLWPLLHATFATGDTYPFVPDSSEDDIHKAWVELPTATFVACNAAGELIGSYYIKPNQPGLGSHVCNCGYLVAPAARGQGVAAAMCRDSQQQALGLGFLAMQFNLVVSTNLRAVRLWQHMGFTIIGTLPGAFRHQQLGLVDAYLMFKTLQAEPQPEAGTAT